MRDEEMYTQRMAWVIAVLIVVLLGFTFAVNAGELVYVAPDGSRSEWSGSFTERKWNTDGSIEERSRNEAGDEVRYKDYKYDRYDYGTRTWYGQSGIDPGLGFEEPWEEE